MTLRVIGDLKSVNMSNRIGDLNGNVEKLKKQLRLLRYPEKDFMQEGVFNGKPMSLLPILHFVFLGFSDELAE